MFLLEWLEAAVAWVWSPSTLLAPIFGSDSGWSWVLSIVGLVVVIRIALIPLFVKQINAQRGMQLIQPRIKEIQKKYAGDREKQSAEMMKIYKETGLIRSPLVFPSSFRHLSSSHFSAYCRASRPSHRPRSGRLRQNWLRVPTMRRFSVFRSTRRLPTPTKRHFQRRRRFLLSY